MTNPIILIASGAGVGFLPLLPGTFGTFAGLPVSIAINHLALVNLPLAAGILAALILIAMMIADHAARLLGTKDPQLVVIDEIAGFAVANFLNETTTSIIAAFLLFRVFDIAKVFPGRRLEKLPGGAGIVLDDVLAGLYTLVILRSLSWTGWL